MNFNDPIHFFWQEKRDRIRRPIDSLRWKFNFMLYAANKSSNNSIKIYNYILNATRGLTNYLFLKENTSLLYRLADYKSTFYIPGRFTYSLTAIDLGFLLSLEINR